MSDCSNPSETPVSGEQEPTMVTVPVVGSSASNNMATSWNNGDTLDIHESTDICGLSLCNDVVTTSSSSSHISSAICTSEMMSHEASDSTPFMHSAMTHDADSTSESMGVCDDERMIVDGSLQTSLTVHAIVTQDGMTGSHESESSDDQLSVVDNITAQNFLQETDLMNAASSALGHDKSPSPDHDLDKSDIHHNLLALEHQSVASPHDHMEMQNLLHEQQDLDCPVSSMSEYHLDHSQTSELSVGSTSQLGNLSNLQEVVTADGVCLSPSSNSSTSSLDLPSGVSISSGIGLPPVSTIIRSSAKGRFDVFCRPSNINMIMGIPQYLSNSNSFDVMTSINNIQRLSSSPCDSLNNVSLASPMEVSSSRHNSCTDVVMENVDVPLSSSLLVCSSTPISHVASIVESRCIKANSVMSSLGPDIMDKDSLSDITDSHLESDNSLNLQLTSRTIPNFIGVVPLREIMHISPSPPQVSHHLSPLAIEEMQKAAEINEHFRSGSAVDSPFSLHSSDESIARAMLSPHFSVGESLQSDNYVECISQRSQPVSVSAIGTNVIVSTSNIDTSPKFTVADIKAIEHRLRTEQSRNQNMENVNHNINDSALNSEIIIPDCIETSQSSDIMYSDVQDALRQDAATRKILKAHNIVRSTIIEKNLLQQSQINKNESTVITSADNIASNKLGIKTSQNNNELVTIKTNDKVAISNSQADTLHHVNPSAVTASVIQQLLRAQSPPEKIRSTLQRVPRGVITSVMSSKGESLTHQDVLITSSSPVQENSSKKEENESNISVSSASVLKDSSLIDSTNNTRNKSVVSLDINEHSVISHGSKSPSSSEEKDVSISNLTSAVLPSLFPNLSASALASLQSSLSTALPLTIQSSLPNLSIGENSSVASHMASVSPTLSSPPLSPILLPSILSTTLRNTSTKVPILDSIVTSNCVTSTNSIYSGLLKSVGLSNIVKQESSIVTGSGPLPPFTVVSGLSPLVKRDFSASLASNLIGANHTSAQIPVVTIKQEPGASRASASASDFNPSIILNANAALPNIASIHLPSAAAVQLPVVVTTSVAVSTTALTNPVPSQASTIAFAGSIATSVANSTANVVPSPTNCEEPKPSDKKWNCLMCKNGSPCGLHPTQSQGSTSGSGRLTTPPQPVLSGDPAKPFQCTLCGKHLASKNVYQLHLRSHSGEKPFTCNLCGHHFSQKTSLTRHMRSHTGERPFPCDVCGKRFADKERIKIHMRTHTGEKPFACEVCGKRFSQKSTVKRHMSVHTGEKPFKCESCGKGFANRGNLNAHSKTHANT